MYNWGAHALAWGEKMKKKYNIIAEQYLEVCSQNDGTWNFELVIEDMIKYKKHNTEPMRHCLGNFKTVEEGDEFADCWRFYYDKSIFEYELM